MVSSFILKSQKHNSTLWILLVVQLFTVLDIYLVDFDNTNFDPWLANVVCTFTAVVTSISLHLLCFYLVLSSIPSFLLTYFPFRRKGLSSGFVVGRAFTFTCVSLLISVLFFADQDSIFFSSVDFSKCVRLSIESYQKITNLITLILCISIFLCLQSLVTYKSFMENIKLDRITKVKRQFRIYNIIQLTIFPLLWAPIIIITGLPFQRLHEITLSYVIFILKNLRSLQQSFGGLENEWLLFIGKFKAWA